MTIKTNALLVVVLGTILTAYSAARRDRSMTILAGACTLFAVLVYTTLA